jgi:hypothetical protein
MTKNKSDDLFDPNFKATPPSAVFTTTHGAISVTTSLYGEANPERVEREKKAAAHRAEQLDVPLYQSNTSDRLLPPGVFKQSSWPM